MGGARAAAGAAAGLSSAGERWLPGTGPIRRSVPRVRGPAPSVCARTPRFALAKIKASPRVVPAPNSGVGGCRTKALTSSAGGGGGEGAAAGRGLLSLSGTAAKQQGDGAPGRETNSLTAAVAVTTKAAEAQAGRCEDAIAFEAGGAGEVSQTSSACSQDAADASGKFLHPGSREACFYFNIACAIAPL